MMPVRRAEGQAPEELRSLRSLRPLPSSSASSLRDNLLPKGPSPCPCPGVDTPSGAWPPRPAPHDGNHPSGSKRGDGNLSDECRCGGGSLRMNVVAEGFRCGREIALRVTTGCGGDRYHSGGFLLRIMPPSWHPVPACTPRLRCRRAVLNCSSDDAAAIRKSGLEIKNRCSSGFATTVCRRAILLYCSEE